MGVTSIDRGEPIKIDRSINPVQVQNDILSIRINYINRNGQAVTLSRRRRFTINCYIANRSVRFQFAAGFQIHFRTGSNFTRLDSIISWGKLINYAATPDRYSLTFRLPIPSISRPFCFYVFNFVSIVPLFAVFSFDLRRKFHRRESTSYDQFVAYFYLSDSLLYK